MCLVPLSGSSGSLDGCFSCLRDLRAVPVLWAGAGVEAAKDAELRLVNTRQSPCDQSGIAAPVLALALVGFVSGLCVCQAVGEPVLAM